MLLDDIPQADAGKMFVDHLVEILPYRIEGTICLSGTRRCVRIVTGRRVQWLSNRI